MIETRPIREIYHLTLEESAFINDRDHWVIFMEAKVKAISDTTNQTNMNAFIALKTDTFHANGDINTVGHLNNWPTRPDILD